MKGNIIHMMLTEVYTVIMFILPQFTLENVSDLLHFLKECHLLLDCAKGSIATPQNLCDHNLVSGCHVSNTVKVMFHTFCLE